MAKVSNNIVGKNHLPYVQDQIKVRQKILGKQDKSNSDIVWENSRTSWVRLVSSVDIDGGEVPRYDKDTGENFIVFDFEGAQFRERYLGLASENYSGNRLASELPLHGGAELNNAQRFGITDSTSTLPGIQNSTNDGPASYGLGGTEFGLVPMPGVTEFSVKYYQHGTFRKAFIDIRANNKVQFQYVESLYMRLGYTMLIEWGNSIYPKTEDKYSSQGDISSLSLKDDFLNGKDKGLDYFYTKIDKNKVKSCGNYDGFVGQVSNFKWSFEKDGSYKISLELVSIGTVIDSLKVTNPLSTISLLGDEFQKLSQEDREDIISKSRPTALEVYLDTVSHYGLTALDQDAQQGQDQTAVDVFEVLPEDIVTMNATNNFDQLSPEEQQAFLDSLPENVEEEEPIEPQSDSPTTTEPINLVNNQTYKSTLSEDDRKILGGYEGTNYVGCRVGFGPSPNKTVSYVRFGELLNFINKRLLVYTPTIDKPLISIDINEELYCYSNGWQFPSDPLKMIIRYEQNFGNNDVNNINLLPELPKFHDIVDGVQVGRLMNLYISIEFIEELIRDNLDKKEELKLYPFLRDIINNINILLGQRNKLSLRVTEKSFIPPKVQSFEATGEADFVAFNASAVGEFADSDDIAISDSIFQTATVTANRVTEPIVKQVIEIYDEVQPYGKEKLFDNPEENPPINVYGFNKSLNEGNFVTDYSFTTSLTKEYNAMITIGAQAGGRAVGLDSTLFSKWNIGLVDRVIPRKLDYDQVILDKVNDRVDFRKLTNQYKNLLSQLINTQEIEVATGKGGGSIIYTLPDIHIIKDSNKSAFYSQFNNIQTEFFNKGLSYVALTKNISTPFVGFLPVDFTVTLDGISGVRVFDKLTVNTDFLPPNYEKTLDFIITAVDHNIKNNKWYTTLKTIGLANLFGDSEVKTAIEIASILEETAVDDDRVLDSLNTDSYFYSDLPFITSTPGKVTINEIIKGLNPSSVVQDSFSAFLQSLIDKIPKGYEIRINSAWRDFYRSNSVYKTKYPISENRYDKALRSPHTYGLALDIALYEPIPGQPGLSTNLLAGKTQEFYQTWIDLGIPDIAKQHNLRWLGTMKDKNGNTYYDCVHFDAIPLFTSSWNSTAYDLMDKINAKYPNIKLVISYGYKTNFRDFGIGDSIYNVSFKNLLNITKGTPPNIDNNTPEILFKGNNADLQLYKSILINGNLEYFSQNKKVNLYNLLTNSIG